MLWHAVLTRDLDAPVDLANAGVGVAALRFDLDALIGHVDDESVEVRAEEVSPDRVRGALVEVARVDQELQEAQDAVGRVLQPVDGELELLFDCSALHRRLLDAFADLAHRKRASRGELDETFFLRFELVELLLQLCLRIAVLREDVRDGRGDRILHPCEHFGRESLLRHFRDDGGFNLLDSYIDHGAELTLVGSADEVLIGASASGVLGVQKSTGAARVAAFAAEEQPLQVVEVNDIPGAVALARIEDGLHLEVGLLRDQCRVASDVELALVSVDAGVVRIAQDRREATGADRLRGVAR